MIAALRDARKASLALIAVALLLVGASYQHGSALGEDRVMYDPIFRWRQSLVVALSREAVPPARHYLGHRDIEEFLERNGLAIQDSENGGVQPKREDYLRFIADGANLDALLARRGEIALDAGRPPVLIQANEKGLADFFSLAFALFGHHVAAFYDTYFVLLLASVAAWIAAFRRAPFALYLLGLYLLVHYGMVEFARDIGLQINTVHNSRFFSFLALLPALHLLLVMVRGEPPTLIQMLAAGLQAGLLFFLLFCRLDTFWLVFMLLLAGGGGFAWRFARRPPPRLRATLRRGLAREWPLLMVAIGCLGYVGYTHFALAREYRLDSGTHLFWHSLYVGLISTHPTLQAEYLSGPQDEYTDNVGYMAAIKYLQERNDASSPIAFRLPDGRIWIDLMRGWGEYDRIMRAVTLQLVRKHPLEVIGSLYYKLRDQLEMWGHVRGYEVQRFVPALLGSLALAVIAVGAMGVPLGLRGLRRAGWGLAAFVPASLVTPAIVPSPLAVAILGGYAMLIVFALTFLPLAAAWQAVAYRGSFWFALAAR